MTSSMYDPFAFLDQKAPEPEPIWGHVRDRDD